MTGPVTMLRGRRRASAIAAAAAALASAGALAACGSSASSAGSAAGGTSAGPPAVSLATSLSTAADNWAVVPVSANPTFWEVLVRPTASATWQLVTPPGVADNGGLVAATTGSSFTVAVRPSQNLLFSPLASTADAGTDWSTEAPLSAGVAASPDALAADGNSLLAVLGDGTIEASANTGSTWRTLAKPGTIAASPAAKGCGTVTVTSVTFGLTASQLLAAGSCGSAGATAIFSYSASGGWQRLSSTVSGHLVRLFADGPALVQAKAGLTALWPGSAGYAWAGSVPPASSQSSAAGGLRSAPLPVVAAISASGELAGAAEAAGATKASGATKGAGAAKATRSAEGTGAAGAPEDGVWILLSGGQAATIGGPGQQWLLLPPVPASTKALASGPGGAVDAIASSGATLTVWRLAHGATVWSKIQAIAVPIQYGSSS